MYSLEIILRINRTSSGPVRRPAPLSHPRLLALRRDVLGLPVDEAYRTALLRSLVKYGSEIVERPMYAPDEGWDDLEALQQVTLGDMMERRLRGRAN